MGPDLSLGRWLLRAYWRTEQILAPGLRYSQEYFQDALESYVGTGASWLDVGAGWHLLPRWKTEEERLLVGRAGKIIGLDLDEPALRKHRTISDRVIGNLEQLPFDANSFDLVTANMVVEHLGDPTSCFAEVKRVLRPGGHFLFHTPSADGYPLGSLNGLYAWLGTSF